jgi:hypothetical protein
MPVTMLKPTPSQAIAGWVIANPGTQFSMSDLAATLGVGRSTVHKTLGRLLSGGIVRKLSGSRGSGHRTSLAILLDAEMAAIAAGKSTPPASSLSGTGTRGGDFSWRLSEGDFASPEAIRAAYGRTVAAGLIEQSEAALMRFAAAIARAQRVARNACAFVAAFVRGKVPWSFICAADEDAGRALVRMVVESVPGYVAAVVGDIARRALARLKTAVTIPKPSMTMSANVPDPAPTPDTIGRHVWCYLMDGKTLSYAAEQVGVPADQAIAAVRRHAEKCGPDHVKRLEGYLTATRPKPLKRERVQQ